MESWNDLISNPLPQDPASADPSAPDPNPPVFDGNIIPDSFLDLSQQKTQNKRALESTTSVQVPHLKTQGSRLRRTRLRLSRNWVVLALRPDDPEPRTQISNSDLEDTENCR